MLIMQAQVDSATRTYALEHLNTLGFTVFIIGLMLMLLIVVHWYRMKAKVEAKGKGSRRKKKKYGRETDPMLQLEFMNREELKQMILAERAKNEEHSGTRMSGDKMRPEPPAVLPGITVNKEQEPSADQTVPPTPVVEELQLFASQPGFIVSEKQGKTPGITPSVSGMDPNTALLAGLVIPDDIAEEKDSADTKPVPPKNPYTDKVERGALSSELPDEFKGKSRKI